MASLCLTEISMSSRWSLSYDSSISSSNTCMNHAPISEYFVLKHLYPLKRIISARLNQSKCIQIQLKINCGLVRLYSVFRRLFLFWSFLFVFVLSGGMHKKSMQLHACTCYRILHNCSCTVTLTMSSSF